MNSKKTIIIVLVIILAFGLMGGLVYLNGIKKDSENTNNSSSGSYTSGNTITLNGTSIEAPYGTTLNGTTLTITKGGTYTVTGTLEDGSIVINADHEEVTLVLSNAEITSSTSAPIYVMQAEKVTLVLADGTTNTLTDSSNHSVDTSGEPDGVIFSKDDLVIDGTGTLKITANYADGIVSKDTLLIKNGTIIIDSADDGIRGKDSVVIENGTFTISAKGDAIKSTNDTDATLGYVTIENGTFDLKTEKDGIQAETTLTIKNGEFKIVTTGDPNSDSAKGLKAGTSIVIENGSYTIDATDDGIHSNGDITINDGTITVTSDDDAVHADGKLEVNGGTYLLDAHEGFEATYVLVNDGDITINASDDGINAGNKSNDYDVKIEITGGTITIKMAQGDTDGIDANGDIIVSGGTINITGQSAFDYDGNASYTGGTIIVNGETVNAITGQFMGGGMQGGMAPGGFRR